MATDAVTTAYHAIHRRGEIKKDETVFLFGLGGLGFNALQIIRAIGARVLVSDIKQENLDGAIGIGVAREDVVPVGKNVQEWVVENGWDRKIDVVADFVGTNQTFEDAQHIGTFPCYSSIAELKNDLNITYVGVVRQAGRMLCVGTLNHENTVHMKVGIRKRLSIIFSYGGQTRDLKEALDLIAQGVLDPIVTDRKIADFPYVLRELEAGRITGRIALLHE